MPGHDGNVLYECEGRDVTVKTARQAAARRVLEQLGSQPHLFERSQPKLLPGWRLPDHLQPPLATAGRVIFIDLQNQQSAVRTFLARPTDFVVGFLSSRGTATVPFTEAPWPIMVVHSQARDVVHAAICWELCKVLMGDGLRLPPDPPLDVVIVSRNLFTEALRDVVRLDPETSARARVVHIEDSADVPL